MRGFFSRINPTVRGLLIVAAIAFFIAIAIVLYLLWRDRLRWEIETWGDRPRWVFYGAGALILVDLGAFFAFGASGLGAVAFLLVLGICGYAMYRTWRDQRNLSY
jgi:hypothetical protein